MGNHDRLSAEIPDISIPHDDIRSAHSHRARAGWKFRNDNK